MTGASARHNRIATEICHRMLNETDDLPEALVMLESIIVGMLTVAHPNLKARLEYLDVLTDAVIERLK